MKTYLVMMLILAWISYDIVIIRTIIKRKSNGYVIDKFSVEMGFITLSIMIAITALVISVIPIIDYHESTEKEIKLIEEQNIILLDIKNSLNSKASTD